jgi:hypothetical protein
MLGMSADDKGSIAQIIEDLFDRIALQLIGDIPKLRNAKRLIISGEQNFGLPHLFVRAMANKPPNEIEKDVLKSLLESSHGYIESLKNRTRSNVTESLDGLVKQAKLQNRAVKSEEIKKVISEEFDKAGSHLKLIAESEGSKLRNLGTMMDISKRAANLGDDDPTVYFILIKDQFTCKECIKLHTVNGVTPRLWKFSELKQGYHKRGEEFPSAFGLHPHCRCTLAYLSKGMGFDKNGMLKYIDVGYDMYSAQRSA